MSGKSGKMQIVKIGHPDLTWNYLPTAADRFQNKCLLFIWQRVGNFIFKFKCERINFYGGYNYFFIFSNNYSMWIKRMHFCVDI